MKDKPAASTDQPVNPDTMSAEILASLQDYSRAVPRQAAANVLEAFLRLTPEDLYAYGKKRPDGLVQAGIMLLKAAGYADRVDLLVEGSPTVAFARRLDRMSDAELEAEYQRRLEDQRQNSEPPARPKVTPLPQAALERLPVRQR